MWNTNLVGEQSMAQELIYFLILCTLFNIFDGSSLTKIPRAKTWLQSKVLEPFIYLSDWSKGQKYITE